MALRTMFQNAVKSCSSALPTIYASGARAYSGRYVNSVQLLGRVGREPQKLGTSDAVAFPMYTESTLKLKDGTVKSYPCWHKVLVVRKTLADLVLSNVERGQRVHVSGRIAYRAPESSPDGKLIYSHQAAIVTESIIFLEKSRKTRTDDAPFTEAQDDVAAAAAKN